MIRCMNSKAIALGVWQSSSALDLQVHTQATDHGRLSLSLRNLHTPTVCKPCSQSSGRMSNGRESLTTCPWCLPFLERRPMTASSCVWLQPSETRRSCRRHERRGRPHAKASTGPLGRELQRWCPYSCLGLARSSEPPTNIPHQSSSHVM